VSVRGLAPVLPWLLYALQTFLPVWCCGTKVVGACLLHSLCPVYVAHRQGSAPWRDVIPVQFSSRLQITCAR
jgi:hypothetical protein